jgi:hypothetical protein
MTNSFTYATGQQIHIDPYNGRLFDFNKHQSRVYLGRSINQLLNVFGDNCIIDGLKITAVDLEEKQLNNQIINNLVVNISPGKAIIDTTLIEFPNPILLEADVTSVDDSTGYFIVSIAYNYLQDTFNNKAKFKLSFIDNSGYSPHFYTEMEKIILTKIDINKSNLSANWIYSYYTNSEVLTINDKEYKLFPPDNITKNIIRSIQEVFFI